VGRCVDLDLRFHKYSIVLSQIVMFNISQGLFRSDTYIAQITVAVSPCIGGSKMGYRLRILDSTTRAYMLMEFEAACRMNKYFLPKALTEIGRLALRSIIADAIRNGTEKLFCARISNPIYWKPRIQLHEHSANRKRFDSQVEVYAETEFNYWYVRGYAKRLISENVELCQIQRLAPSKLPCGYCMKWENRIVPVSLVYHGSIYSHWFEKPRRGIVCIPAHLGCKHAIWPIGKRQIHLYEPWEMAGGIIVRSDAEKKNEVDKKKTSRW
jgi:hypothetical protein